MLKNYTGRRYCRCAASWDVQSVLPRPVINPIDSPRRAVESTVASDRDTRMRRSIQPCRAASSCSCRACSRVSCLLRQRSPPEVRRKPRAEKDED